MYFYLKQDHSHLGFINDRIKKAEKRLEQNPYDVEAWSIIVRDAQVIILKYLLNVFIE